MLGSILSPKSFLRAIVPAALMTACAYAADLAKIPFETADGKTTSLSEYKGKVVLVVNVASKCGLTKQYTALEALYKEHKKDDFVILGFPCNDFKGQEPGTIEEIQKF